MRAPICGLLQCAYIDEGTNIVPIPFLAISTSPFPEDDLLLWTLQAYTHSTLKSCKERDFFLYEPSWFVPKVELGVKNSIILLLE